MPDAAVSVTVVTVAPAGHVSGLEVGDPAAKMLSPLFPPRLNFTGTAAPALLEFNVPGTIGRLKSTEVERRLHDIVDALRGRIPGLVGRLAIHAERAHLAGHDGIA